MEAKWTLREQLILASAVQKSGDQNWVSVTRAIKPLMEDKRSADFFSQKNCAMQYARMLDKANAPKRTKRSSKDSESVGETAQELIVRQLTEKRIVELDRILDQIKAEYMSTLKEIEDVQNDKLGEREMLQMLEAMASAHRGADELYSSAVQSPLGTEEAKPPPPPPAPATDTATDMDTDSRADTSQALLQTSGDQNQMSTAPAISAPTTLPVKQEVTYLPPPAEKPPTTMAAAREAKPQLPATSPALVAPVPPAGAPRPTSLSPTSPPIHLQAPPQHQSPPGGQSAAKVPTEPSSSPVCEEGNEGEEENPLKGNLPEAYPMEVGDDDQFLANVALCEKEHAYASKSGSPLSHVSPPLGGSAATMVAAVSVPSTTTDGTLVSKVQSMVIAMGNENVLVSDLKVTTIDPKLSKPPLCLFAEGGREEDPDVDKEMAEGDSKSEEEEEDLENMNTEEEQEGEREPEELQSLRTAESRDESKRGAVASSGTEEKSKELPSKEVDQPEEEEPEEQPRSPVVVVAEVAKRKDRSQSPEIDVESVVSSPLARDNDESTPSTTPPTSARPSRKSKGKRKTGKRDRPKADDNEQTKAEEKVKETTSVSESKSSRGKTRSSKRGVVKKEDSDQEDEEIALATVRRSGRVKDKKDIIKQEDSEMEDSTAMSSTVNSPSSSLNSDLTAEQTQAHRAWKKAIMLVWRQIAMHKYANLFLQPVKDDDATGYSEVVHRPVDLSIIKRNIESGVIRTDIVFQRDVLLMFQNALMYNSSDHDVHKMAEEMRADSIDYIQEYLTTQLMVRSTGKSTVRTRRAEAQEKTDEDANTKRGSRKPSSEDAPPQSAAKRKKL